MTGQAKTIEEYRAAAEIIAEVEGWDSVEQAYKPYQCRDPDDRRLRIPHTRRLRSRLRCIRPESWLRDPWHVWRRPSDGQWFFGGRPGVLRYNICLMNAQQLDRAEMAYAAAKGREEAERRSASTVGRKTETAPPGCKATSRPELIAAMREYQQEARSYAEADRQARWAAHHKEEWMLAQGIYWKAELPTYIADATRLHDIVCRFTERPPENASWLEHRAYELSKQEGAGDWVEFLEAICGERGAWLGQEADETMNCAMVR